MILLLISSRPNCLLFFEVRKVGSTVAQTQWLGACKINKNEDLGSGCYHFGV